MGERRGQGTKRNNHKEICYKFLKESTITQAIPRINECLILRQFDFKAPILDLGCGEGVFARICFGEKKVDVGLDVNPRVARQALKSGAYQKVVIAQGSKIPFEDAFFNTVISNSVLEHIEDLDPVFSEVYRVLKKNGRFIFIVSDKIASDYYFYSYLLKKIKLESLSNIHTNFKIKLYLFQHLEDKRFWEKTSQKGGFRIKNIIGIISPRIVRIIDFFSITALPDYLLRRIFGRSFIFRPDFVIKIITPYILGHTGPVKESEATGWCFELEKK